MFERIKVKKLNDHIYLMDDNGEATGYLVVGEKKALVIDTMNGYANVYDVVRTLTDLPLMVVNTHGHCDHYIWKSTLYLIRLYFSIHPVNLLNR